MADETKAPQLDFNGFVVSLGSSVLIHLGRAPDPTTGEKNPPDLVLAQQSIDLLGMLQEKTRGNLTDDEARLLDQMLFDLRLLYVQVAKEPARAAP